MIRAVVAVVVVVAAGLVLGAGCVDAHIGDACAVGDEGACADGYECAAYCGSAGEWLCTPRVGDAKLPRGGVVDSLSIASREDAVQFAAVTEVRGNFVIDLAADSELAGVSFPLLTHVDEDVLVQNGDALACLEVQALVDVGGAFAVEGNASLAGITATLLDRVGGLTLKSNTSLSTFQPPVLERVGGDVVVENNSALVVLGLGRLAAVDGDIRVRANGAQLHEIDLAELACVSGEVEISDESETCIELASLARPCADVDDAGACVLTCPAAAACSP